MSPLRKSCLRLATPMPSPGLSEAPPKPKAVVFCDGDEEVFQADDWDRTPHEPSLKLSYSDILELKAIQRSLPRANQLPDPFCGKRAATYLNKVPINLLPLLPDSTCCSADVSADSSAYPSRVPSPNLPFAHSPSWASDVQPMVPVTMTRHPATAPTAATYYPPHLAHLRKVTPQPSQPKKIPFSFVPLLGDGKPSSEVEPPSSATPSHHTPTPLPAPSSSEPPPFFLLPPGRQRDTKQDFAKARSLFPTTPHSSDIVPSSPTIIRKRNVMMVNGMEIDLDDDPEPEPLELQREEESTDESAPPSNYSDSSAPHTETETSDTEDEEPASATPSPNGFARRLPRLSFSSQSSSSSQQSSWTEPSDNHPFPRIAGNSPLVSPTVHMASLPVGLCGEKKPSAEWNAGSRTGGGVRNGHVLQLA